MKKKIHFREALQPGENVSQISRRQMISLSSAIALIPMLGLSLSSCRYLFPSEIDNWEALSTASDGQGTLRLEKLDGEARIGARNLTSGSIIGRNETIELHSGTALLSLPDKSVIKLSRGAVLSSDLDSRKGGVLTLKKGGILAVVDKSRRKPYLLRNASAVIGIKGTVFYSQVLSSEDRKQGRIPESATDYFCLCNGQMDILVDDFARVKSDRAEYHNAYFLQAINNSLDIKPAGFLLNHSDDEISDVIREMPRWKHRTDWLYSTSGMYSTY